jgi:hypothetical protein
MKQRISAGLADFRSVDYTRTATLHVTHCGEEHLIQLTSDEAATLVDACALLLLASNSAPGCKLNSSMSGLLQTLFEQFSSHSV